MSGPSDKTSPHVSRPVSTRISSIWYRRIAIGLTYISMVPDEYIQPFLLHSLLSYSANFVSIVLLNVLPCT